MFEFLGDNRDLKLRAIGDSLIGLGSGQYQQSPAFAALQKRQQRAEMERQLQDSGIMERFTPEQQMILAQMEPSAAQSIIAQQVFAPKPKPKVTDDITEYNFALSQGYTG